LFIGAVVVCVRNGAAVGARAGGPMDAGEAINDLAIRLVFLLLCLS